MSSLFSLWQLLSVSLLIRFTIWGFHVHRTAWFAADMGLFVTPRACTQKSKHLARPSTFFCNFLSFSLSSGTEKKPAICHGRNDVWYVWATATVLCSRSRCFYLFLCFENDSWPLRRNNRHKKDGSMSEYTKHAQLYQWLWCTRCYSRGPSCWVITVSCWLSIPEQLFSLLWKCINVCLKVIILKPLCIFKVCFPAWRKKSL